MLSSLTLVTFLSPPDQGEKISLGISILLSFSVFMLSMSENMPKTSETLPLFGEIFSLIACCTKRF
jgi:nicotinic acetylcholine receptor, invertebrate